MSSIMGLPEQPAPVSLSDGNIVAVPVVSEAVGENPVRPLNVRQFRAYQLRLPVTAACLLIGLLLTLLSKPAIPIGSAWNEGLIAAGYLLIVCGIGIRIWSISYIHSRKSVSIVSTGPYALCRNPLYVGTFIIVVAYLLMVQSVTLALFTLPVIFLYLWGVIPAEETVLRSRHQELYNAYCAAVPRWFPRFQLSAFRMEPIVWCPAVRREIECAVWWIGIALLVHWGCSYRSEPWWIHPLNCP